MTQVDPVSLRDASLPAPPTADEFLARVEGWIRRLAARVAPRLGMPLDEFVDEVRIDVFLNLAAYDPSRGRPTTWVAWRVRKVHRSSGGRPRHPA